MEKNRLYVLSGLPHGTVLGPLFFLIYINDISNNLSKGTTIRLFADDSLLYRSIKNEEGCRILQKDLNTLQSWEAKWKMECPPEKCQVLKITNKVKYVKYNYFIHNVKLLEVESAKYLGVIIDNKLKWQKQNTNVCRKANSLLSFLQRNLYNCPLNVKNTCYKAIVRPVLEYGCSVWDLHHQVHIQNLEKVQKRAARFATNKLQNGDWKHKS